MRTKSVCTGAVQGHRVDTRMPCYSNGSLMRGRCVVQAQVSVGNVFSRGAWWQNLLGGKRDFTFGICAPPSPSSFGCPSIGAFMRVVCILQGLVKLYLNFHLKSKFVKSRRIAETYAWVLAAYAA